MHVSLSNLKTMKFYSECKTQYSSYEVGPGQIDPLEYLITCVGPLESLITCIENNLKT